MFAEGAVHLEVACLRWLLQSSEAVRQVRNHQFAESAPATVFRDKPFDGLHSAALRTDHGDLAGSYGLNSTLMSKLRSCDTVLH